MTDGFQLFEILVLAALAAFVIYRLRSTLGKRTGHERPRPNPYAARDNSGEAEAARDNGERVMPPRGEDDARRAARAVAPEGSALAQALTEIQLADRNFDPEHFAEGARQAYEMIVTAFAEGDRRTLRQLTDDAVYAEFDSALTAREAAGERVETTFVGISSAKITDARLVDRIAEVTVKFVSELISVTKNADGAVIKGDPTAVRQVRDIWTFARDTRSHDPNWLLVGTATA
jgi:predicted lipid-binding transport protein (Tim44 family)